MTDPFAHYDLWLESGPVDALTEAEYAAEHEDEPGTGPNPDEAYELARERRMEEAGLRLCTRCVGEPEHTATDHMLLLAREP